MILVGFKFHFFIVRGTNFDDPICYFRGRTVDDCFSNQIIEF